MSTMMRLWSAIKAPFTSMQWARTSSWFSMLLGSTLFDYRASAGDGRSNAAVMACVRWAQRTLPEAPLTVYTRTRDGELKPAPEHALQERLERPNPFYSGLHLLGALLADLMLTGNAYAIKVRTADRRVAELWWVPSSLMEPAWPDDGSVYISHYEYRVEGNVVMVDVSDVIHIREGFDPNNVRKGMSDLASLYREIASDNEAANWTGSLLRNGAVPGVVISPESDEALLTPDDAEDIKLKFMQRFGGDQKGAPLVVPGRTKVEVLSFNPEQMNLRDLRIVPEERITAVLGIPAIVVGLGAGLQRSTFANFAEAREAAYESFVIPKQRLICAELQNQLVPDFGDPARLRVAFDLSQVRVLQDDQNALHERARADLIGGLISRNEARQMIGVDPLEGPEGDVIFVPNTITVTPPDRLIPPEPVEEPPTGAESDEDEEGMPRPALAAAGAVNGHHKAASDLGPALVLSEDDLDRLAEVGPEDLPGADRFWRRVVDDDLGDLLDAKPEGDG